MPLEWGWISQEASGVSCRVSSSFSSSKRQHGISWETLWRKRALSPMEGRISLLLWSYGGSLRFLSSCAGTLGTHSCFVGEVRSAFLLRGAPRDSYHIAVGMNRASSRVEAGTSGFLSISDTDLTVSVEFKQGRQASSCVEALNSAFLLSCE